MTLNHITIDNANGDNRGGKEVGHNTDGFDIGASNGVYIYNPVVHNQDDCLCINSGQVRVFGRRRFHVKAIINMLEKIYSNYTEQICEILTRVNHEFRLTLRIHGEYLLQKFTDESNKTVYIWSQKCKNFSIIKAKIGGIFSTAGTGTPTPGSQGPGPGLPALCPLGINQYPSTCSRTSSSRALAARVAMAFPLRRASSEVLRRTS